MALAIMQFAFPVLAGFGLTSLFKDWKENTLPKNFPVILLSITGGFLLIGLIFAGAAKDFYLSAMAGSANQTFQSVAKQLPDLQEFVWGVMTTDFLLIGALLAAFGILTWMLIKNKLTMNAYIPAIIFLLLFDLWRMDWRPLEIPKTDTVKESLKSNDVIDFLKNDKNTYRIADFAMANVSPNLPAYYRLENVGGYHPAKLRVYQDMLDVADQGSTNQVTNPFLWNLLNVKYIVANQQMGPQPIFQSKQTGWFVYENNTFMPRAFFVDSAIVLEPMKILKNMKEGNFNPMQVAYTEKPINAKIETPLDGAKIDFLERKNEKIKLRVTATGTHLVFLSEIYFPMWKATIDNKPTEIFKTDYAFRSVVVPKGEHIVEFKLETPGFETGKMLSIGANILLALLLVAGIFMEWKSKKSE